MLSGIGLHLRAPLSAINNAGRGAERHERSCAARHSGWFDGRIHHQLGTSGLPFLGRYLLLRGKSYRGLARVCCAARILEQEKESLELQEKIRARALVASTGVPVAAAHVHRSVYLFGGRNE